LPLNKAPSCLSTHLVLDNQVSEQRGAGGLMLMLNVLCVDPVDE
jgi:hypothetical protein